MSDKPNYQGNSHKSKEEKTRTKPEIKKVIEGTAVERKKPVGRKFSEMFMGDDARSVGNYLLIDVAIPAAKSLIMDLISQGIERALYGDSRPRSSRDHRPGYTNYNKISKKDERREMSRYARANHDFREIILESRGDAEEVLDTLTELISEYDVATIADLYEMVNITGSIQDDKWGWTTMRGASVRPIRGGYLLDLPRPVSID